MIKTFGEKIPNIPWEKKPADCPGPVWRYSKNPVIGRNPIPNVTRIFNSAVATWKGGEASVENRSGNFVGVFRAETCNGISYLYFGFSDDALNWKFSEGKMNITDENGHDANPQLRLRSAPDKNRRHLPYRLVHGFSRSVNRNRHHARLPHVHHTRKRLPSVQSKRRAFSAKSERKISHAHPTFGQRAHSVWRHFHLRERRPFALGKSQMGDGKIKRMVAVGQNRRGMRARRNRRRLAFDLPRSYRHVLGIFVFNGSGNLGQGRDVARDSSLRKFSSHARSGIRRTRIRAERGLSMRRPRGFGNKPNGNLLRRGRHEHRARVHHG